MRNVGFVLAMVAGLSPIGQGARAEPWADCANTAAHGQAIAACSDLLEQAQRTGLSRRDIAAAFFNRGAAYSRGGDHARALGDYGAAIRADPSFAHAYNGRGTLFAFKGQYTRAIEDYDRALGIDPGFTDALNNRADAWRNLGQAGRALADLDRLIAIDPEFPEAFLTRGEVILDQGDLARARGDIETGIALDPDGPNRDYALALISEIDRQQRAGPAPAPSVPGIAETRVALVIGNSAYEKTGQLANPTKDADLIAEALKRTGFDHVDTALDLDRGGMVRALQDFGTRADEADWAVVYFAGHGLEIGGVNYLVPVDARLISDRDVADEAITLERVLAAVEGADKLRLVVLDACRNNPFLAAMQSTSATRSVGRGLARVEPSRATLVAYAAKEGTLAADGAAGNSPFAAALAKRMTESGLEINKVFRFVRSDVLATTEGRQEPFVYGSLPPQDFFFVPPG